MSLTVEPKQAPTAQNKQAVFEVEFQDANGVLVNDSNNSYKHYIKAPINEKPKDYKELFELKTVIGIEGNILKITETYELQPRDTPYKLTYCPRVNFYLLSLLVFVWSKGN